MPRKERTGVVVSDKMSKCRVVLIEDRVQHPLYKKVQVHSKRYKVSDPEERSHVGDLVRIQESRPLSKHIRWVLLDIIKQSEEV
ncbi:MAG: 30S ribosomal protein S17 [Cyanobacteria bacterium HKST-UBA06]|nr:30S ribosomal protein S17 [Cyanobacteria bacterium HKST-UBA04]MCA9806977.1 30S ribosomal protein S17 [Cyanobacteria bacterium HKST-UBA06]MCA9841718.1 30S ribosomal protein S17 [Cyanobacteria bacterium HKST-UBA03]